jgi:Glycosyltransferase family 87
MIHEDRHARSFGSGSIPRNRAQWGRWYHGLSQRDGDGYPMQNRNVKRLLIYVGVVLSLIYFTVRGPWRAVEHSPDRQQGQDFPNFYASSRAWLFGEDPYDQPALEATFAHTTPKQHWISGALSSPTAFPLLAPIGSLPYAIAEVIWLMLNIGFLLLSIRLLAGVGDFQHDRERLAVFTIIALALAGIHASLALGQVTMTVTLFVVASLIYQSRQQTAVSGACLGVALALKPQMAIAFLAYHVITRHWRLALSAVTVLGALTAIAVGRMSLAHVAWLQSYYHNFAAFSAGPGDPQLSAAGVPVHDGLPSLMLNLQVPLSLFISNRLVVELVTMAAAAALILVIVLLRLDAKVTSRTELLVYGYLAAVAPLVVYSRMYTTTLLLLPSAWAISAYRTNMKRLALIVFFCIVPFLVPGAGILARLAPSVPPGVRNGFIWRGVLMPHQTYALIVMALAMLLAAFRSRIATSR